MNLSKAMTPSMTNKKLESSEMSDLSERNTNTHDRHDVFLFFIHSKSKIFPARLKMQAACPTLSGLYSITPNRPGSTEQHSDQFGSQTLPPP